MPFNVSWHTLLDELEELPDGATLITPLSHKRFRITDVQEHRVIIQFEESGENRPLQRDQFETLHQRIQDSQGRFQLDRLPPDADPYPAVLSPVSYPQILFPLLTDRTRYAEFSAAGIDRFRR